MTNLFNWLLNLTNTTATMATWLTSTLPYVNLTPLELFSVAGITALISIHLVKLFIS